MDEHVELIEANLAATRVGDIPDDSRAAIAYLLEKVKMQDAMLDSLMKDEANKGMLHLKTEALQQLSGLALFYNLGTHTFGESKCLAFFSKKLGLDRVQLEYNISENTWSMKYPIKIGDPQKLMEIVDGMMQGLLKIEDGFDLVRGWQDNE